MLWPLALAQVVSWGTLYYSFSLFAGPMREELGWSPTAINGALTAGLLVTGLMAYPVGTLFERHGARWLMTGGSLGAGLGLLCWSRVASLPQFYLLWLVLGALMSCVLIEAVFVVIHQQFGAQARRAMTAMTMVTGFSGTVFVPLIGHLLPALGWRQSLEILAAFNLFFCVPVHCFFTPPRGRPHADPTRTDAHAGRVVMRERLRNPIFWGLVCWYTSYSLTASSLIFQLVPVLSAEQVPSGNILLCFALIGPVQVVARLLIITVGRRASTVRLGAMTSSIVPLGLLVLIFAPPSLPWLCVFAICFGVGHGVTTILRGVAPAEWLGHDYYARTMGAIALPMMLAMAIAPLLSASVWGATGSPRAVWSVILAGSLAGSAGYWFAVHKLRRQRAGGNAL
ncbi:MAG: MFS transporter [Gammaproteobacteria bacterium]|nr:MFS transporter [Gammaproteobacteria bacterium]